MTTQEIENELKGIPLGELSDMTVGQFAKMLSDEDPDQKLVLFQKRAEHPVYLKIVKVDQFKSEELGALVLEVKKALKEQVNERKNETEEEKLERMKRQIEMKLADISSRRRRRIYLDIRKKELRNRSELEKFIYEYCRNYPGVVRKRGPKPKKKVPEL